ncbi:MAG: hypothetical protein PHV64_04515, partial [Bacteroidales bacterium]|nr:hypothetical protein [Bacteroidales bacterium]
MFFSGGRTAAQVADTLSGTVQDSLVVPVPDSLTRAYLDSLHIPYSEAARVPDLDSLLRMVRDEEGLFYKLDSLG